MTPRSIETGRGLTATTSLVAIDSTASAVLAPADASRCSLTAAVAGDAFTDAVKGIGIGVLVSGTLVPLTCLTAGHPVCYLSVDKMGTLVTQEIRATNLSGGNVTIGVSVTRQVQPWGEE